MLNLGGEVLFKVLEIILVEQAPFVFGDLFRTLDGASVLGLLTEQVSWVVMVVSNVVALNVMAEQVSFWPLGLYLKLFLVEPVFFVYGEYCGL